MNIMFCGDHRAEDGILIVLLSLLQQMHTEVIHVYLLTMSIDTANNHYQAFSKQKAIFYEQFLKETNPENSLELINCNYLFHSSIPKINIESRFTPYAMLRLFANQIPQIPDRILYLDDDVIIRRPITELYKQDLIEIEIAGVLDYWGRFFFHNIHTHRVYDYFNFCIVHFLHFSKVSILLAIEMHIIMLIKKFIS